MKPFIVANWKMNPISLAKAKQLFNEIKKTKAIICPPFVYLSALRTSGAQDCFWENQGAFTGEVSPKQLKDFGCKYVLIGHSERRKYQGETEEMINKKLKAVLEVNLRPILCIEKISQIKRDINGISKEKLGEIILAYEPVWAIGSGKACGISVARKMNSAIRKILKKNILLYGGSVNSQNVKGFIKEAGFQGVLIGKASLNAKEFIKIVESISN